MWAACGIEPAIYVPLRIVCLRKSSISHTASALLLSFGAELSAQLNFISFVTHAKSAYVNILKQE